MQTTTPIIDIHCHTAGIGAGASGCIVSPALRNNIRYHFFLKAFGVNETELQQQGDRLILQRLSDMLKQSRHVSAAVILAMDGPLDLQGNLDTSRTEILIPNDFLARECRQHDNLLFGASINPHRRDALDRLDQAADEGAVLIKWLPSIQGIDPADRRLEPFYRRLQERGIPLLSHTGNEESFTYADNALADPQRLRLPLELGVTVIAAHCASNGRNQGQRNQERLLPLFEQFSNLYADISALTQANRLGHLPKVLRHRHLHGRLLYGSDMPIIATPLTSPLFHAYRMPPGKTIGLTKIRNPWDQDVELKRALGMTQEMFATSARVLNIPTGTFAETNSHDKRQTVRNMDGQDNESDKIQGLIF